MPMVNGVWVSDDSVGKSYYELRGTAGDGPAKTVPNVTTPQQGGNSIIGNTLQNGYTDNEGNTFAASGTSIGGTTQVVSSSPAYGDGLAAGGNLNGTALSNMGLDTTLKVTPEQANGLANSMNNSTNTSVVAPETTMDKVTKGVGAASQFAAIGTALVGLHEQRKARDEEKRRYAQGEANKSAFALRMG